MLTPSCQVGIHLYVCYLDWKLIWKGHRCMFTPIRQVGIHRSICLLLETYLEES